MFEHIKTQYHTVAYEKLLYNKDGENLEESEFLKKHNHKYQGKKRSSDVCTFFQPRPKNKKITASQTTTPSRQRESEVLGNSLTPPPLNRNIVVPSLFCDLTIVK